MKRAALLFFILLCTGSLMAVVGDWKYYGARLTLHDLYISGEHLRAASSDGLLTFHFHNEDFSASENSSQLEHMVLRRYYVNNDGSEWFAYGGGTEGITCITPDERNDFFELGFRYVNAFSGNTSNVLAAYKSDFSPQITHFIKYNQRYIFKDIYNQFPGDPQEIHDITIAGDSIFAAADRGIYKAWLNSANLKPAAAWTLLPSDSTEVYKLFSYGDSLYYAGEEQTVCLYYQGEKQTLFNIDSEPLSFYRRDGSLFFATEHKVYDVFSSEAIYESTDALSGFSLRNDTLWLARESKGLLRVPLSGGEKRSYIPNSMLPLRANALAITEDHRIAVCGLSGVSVLDGREWHNLVFSPEKEVIHNDEEKNGYSADTLNIAYREGGQTAVYDALVSGSGKLYYTITDVTARPVTGQSAGAKGPGALVEIDLNDLHHYTVYDTSDGIIVGTQQLGGSSYYLKMRGLREDNAGNIWALNVHTLDAKPIILFRPDGTVRKYSVEESGGKLQILAREMVFDKYGHLWIANEARQADVPRTTGGITVFDPQNNIWELITSSDGLVSNDVHSLDIDPLTGNIWVATASGVQMIRPPSSLLTTDNFNFNPPLDGLSGIVPKKIRIDPRGNKWILTQSQGVQVYLTNNTWFNNGKGLRSTNSGIPDDVVYDLVFNTQNGFAYLLTESGLSRYETAWTEERSEMEELLIFPQPYRPGIDEYLAIDGLAEQTQVVISTLDGRVIKQFFPNDAENKAKQIVWDGRLDNGKYIPRGVYLVFAENIEGLRATAKFAVE